MVSVAGNAGVRPQVETIAPAEAMGAMARKPTGKVRLHDPATGKIVWVERSAIHQTADELDQVEPPAPAQDAGSSPLASDETHASPSAPSIAPPIAPTIAPTIAPPVNAADSLEDDGDEHDDVAEFLGETKPRRSRMAPSPAPATSSPAASPASSRRSTGDDVADFWAGEDPHVEDGELAT